LSAVVDAEGHVRDIEVIFVPDPDLGFGQAAIEAVREWRYQPGELRGRAISVRLTVVVDFTLY
jgi:TonB family protein